MKQHIKISLYDLNQEKIDEIEKDYPEIYKEFSPVNRFCDPFAFGITDEKETITALSKRAQNAMVATQIPLENISKEFLGYDNKHECNLFEDISDFISELEEKENYKKLLEIIKLCQS